jgi:4-diphosphocytidyl-2-C-methyl-D-erythritol kinase
MTQSSINHALWLEKWPAPAKINLMLRIVGRRDDGYHLLQTVFQFIDLCDWLVFHPAENGEVKLVKTIPGVAEEDDLTVRAAKLLKAETGCKLGVRINVEKNLPMGGGLGGGSSDAATTLLVLNKLWDLQLPKEKLLAMGLTLGADVPVFIFGHASWGEGVGECLKEIYILEQWVIVIKPDCHVNTKEIFSDKNLTRNSKSIKMSGFLEGDHQNDCLSVVVDRYPLVKEAINDLMLFAEARLTGTGACVFAEFGSYQDAKNAYDSLKEKWLVYLAKSTNESPLTAKLNISLNRFL